jgi:hypothetical protein
LSYALLACAIPSQKITGCTADSRSTIYAQLITTTSEVITPAIAAWVEQDDESTSAAIERCSRITLE